MIGLAWHRTTLLHDESDNHAANDITAGRVVFSRRPATLALLPFRLGLSTYCPTTHLLR